MAMEEKQLLLKDLCARLPYGVKYCRYSWNYEWDQEMPVVEILEDIDKDGYINYRKVYKVEDIKPYLRPMESMTEEDLISYANYDFANDDTYKIVDYRCPPGRGFINLYCSSIRHPEERPVIFQRTRTSPLENWRGIDWLNEHHFDYRNLIKMGLAIKAPDGMYNF